MPSGKGRWIALGAIAAFIVATWSILDISMSILDISIGTYDSQNLGDGDNSPLGQDISKASNEIIRYVTDNSWAALYPLTTSETQAAVTAEDFANGWRQRAQSEYGNEQVEILEILVTNMEEEHLIGSTYVYPIVPSEVLPPNVALASSVSGRLAFVLCKSLTDNGRSVTWLSMVLKQERNEWRLVDLHLNPAEVAGHDGNWFWQKSQEFESSGQLRNAFFYGRIALSLLIPSPSITSSKAREMNSQLVDPAPLNLPSPGVRSAEQWKIGENLEVNVHYVNPVTSAIIFWLDVRYGTDLEDVQSEQARIERERVRDYVLATYPEYKDGFAGIFVGSVQADGLGNRDGFPFDEVNPRQAPDWSN